MNITCEKCKTGYSLDEKLLKPTGTPVRCTQCNHVFTAYPPKKKIEEPSIAKLGSNVPSKDKPPSPNEQGVAAQAKKAVRHQTLTGTSQSEPDTNSPQKQQLAKIETNKVVAVRKVPSRRHTEPPPPLKVPGSKKGAETPKPKVSNQLTRPNRDSTENAENRNAATGDTIGSTGTFPIAPPKTLVDPSEQYNKSTNQSKERDSLVTGDALQTPSDTSAKPSLPPTNSLSSPPSDIEPDFSQVPVLKEENWTDTDARISDHDPEWTSSNSTISSIPPCFDDFDLPKRSRTKMFAILAILLMVGGICAYVAIFQKDLIISQFGQVQDSKKEQKLQTLLLEAREKFLLDTPSDFMQAEKIYRKILSTNENHPQALTALAQMYTVWAQYLWDDFNDSQITPSSDPRVDPDAPLPSGNRKEFEEKLEEARRLASLALKITPKSKNVHLVVAEVERLSGNIIDAQKHLAKGRTQATLQDATYIAALIAISEGQNRSEIIGMLKSVITTTPLLRVLYRLARLQAAEEKTEDSNNSLAQILKLNGKHTAALALRKRLAEGHSVTINTPMALGADTESKGDIDTTAKDDRANNKNTKITSASQVSERGNNTSAKVSDNEDESTMNLDVLLRKAVYAQERGKTADAITLFEKVIVQEPSNIDALSGLGYAYLDRGSYGQAVTKFKRALSANARFGPAVIGMAQTYKSMGQPNEAIKWFKKYINTNPQGRHAGMAQRNLDELIDDSQDATAPNKNTAAATSDISNSPGNLSGSQVEEPTVSPAPSQESQEIKENANPPAPLPTADVEVPATPAPPASPINNNNPDTTQ